MGDCGQGVALTVVSYIFLILTVGSKIFGLLTVRGYLEEISSRSNNINCFGGRLGIALMNWAGLFKA